MATLPRPEGLSPCYLSVASPDIPESLKFKWAFRGAGSESQSSYTLRLYNSSGVQIYSTSKTSSTEELDFANLGYSLSLGVTYYWSISCKGSYGNQSEESVKAKFIYKSAPKGVTITWSSLPESGQIIANADYFSDIKSNLLLLCDDYEAPSSTRTLVNRLFMTEIVPSRDDFESLENIIKTLYRIYEENYSYVETADLVFDGLGSFDISEIRRYIDTLTRLRPNAPEDIDWTIPSESMYQLSSFTVAHSGVRDTTASLSWSPEAIPNKIGKVTFSKLSDSRDALYYECDFTYGYYPGGTYTSELFFLHDDLASVNYRTFDMNWDGLYIGSGKQPVTYMYTRTVDKRGNKSANRKFAVSYASNFKVPIGVKHYEIEYQKASLAASSYSTSGKWYDLTTRTSTSVTHTMSGGEGRIWYRARIVDISGMVSDWKYVGPITWDPLTPPDKPGSFRATNITTNSVSFDWNNSARAEGYEFRAEKEWSNIYRGPNSYYTYTGLAANTAYDWFVRAYNRVGYSDWVGLTVKTKSARKTTTWTATGADTWRDNWGWRTGSEGDLVYQGEWCEIQGSPHQSGPAGTCWGKNKGLWYFNDDNMRSTLSGKKIVKVRIWVQRKDWYHGYYYDQCPDFWTHNYDSKPSGQPALANHFRDTSSKFDLGESGWVTLPNKYGELLRDGKARGIGLFVPDWGRLPYLKFLKNAKLEITYE